jgi:hypothetical protein
VAEYQKVFSHVGFFFAHASRALTLKALLHEPFEKGYVMKGFLVLLVLLALGIVGFGFYRGWFSMATENTDRNPTVTFSMDKDKIRDDEEKVKDKVHDLGHKAKDTGAKTDKVQEKDKTDKVQEKERDRQP